MVLMLMRLVINACDKDVVFPSPLLYVILYWNIISCFSSRFLYDGIVCCRRCSSIREVVKVFIPVILCVVGVDVVVVGGVVEEVWVSSGETSWY